MLFGSGVFKRYGSVSKTKCSIAKRVALTTVLHYHADCDHFTHWGVELMPKYWLNEVDDLGELCTCRPGLLGLGIHIMFLLPIFIS